MITYESLLRHVQTGSPDAARMLADIAYDHERPFLGDDLMILADHLERQSRSAGPLLRSIERRLEQIRRPYLTARGSERDEASLPELPRPRLRRGVADEARKTEAQHLRSTGMSVPRIAAMIGASKAAVARWVRTVPLTPEQKDAIVARQRKGQLQPRKDPRQVEARRLRAEGLSIRQIGARIGATPAAVHEWTRDIELPAERLRAIDASGRKRAIETRRARVLEEGAVRSIRDLRAPPLLDDSVRERIDAILFGRGLPDSDAITELVGLTLYHDLIPTALDEPAHCRAIIEAKNKKRVSHLYASTFADFPAIDHEAARAFMRLVYAAGLALDARSRAALGLQALRALGRGGLTLISRREAAFCRQVREALARKKR